jgi:hypothetical protein
MANLATAEQVNNFIKGGKAIVTLQSVNTGVHKTFKIEKAKTGSNYFVSALIGPNNLKDYLYIGFMREGADGRLWLNAGKKGKPTRPDYRGFDALLKTLNNGYIHAGLTVHHIGRCCVCARPLTTPESIESGIGPVCAEKAGV